MVKKFSVSWGTMLALSLILLGIPGWVSSRPATVRANAPVGPGGLFSSFEPQTQSVCTGEFISIAKPLNDLGDGEYVRLESGPTGFHGGLYPGGVNTRPTEHERAGVELGRQIRPLNIQGIPDPAGKIVMVSIGMSNTASEYGAFLRLARNDADMGDAVVLVNGAHPGKVASEWVDPQAETWDYVEDLLVTRELSPMQVQAAWVKLTNFHLDSFPEDLQALQRDLADVVRNLKTHYPNIRQAYLSSRTRSYDYWDGLNPEPGAYETGFAVKWLIAQQLSGDLSLNYDPGRGAVVAPWLSWGPYLWVDGLNPRSDQMVWRQEDLAPDCTHPSNNGTAKVAEQLLAFFKSDPTARPWFTGQISEPTFRIFLPNVMN
jgi:hypothetical protein